MSQGHVKKHLIRELIQPPVAHFKQQFEELKTLISTYTKFGLFITGIPPYLRLALKESYLTKCTETK
jgi:hypothetical protein